MTTLVQPSTQFRWWVLSAMSDLPQSFPLHGLLNKLVFHGGAGVAGAALLASVSSPCRSVVHWRGMGTQALLVHAAFLVAFYTFHLAMQWSQTRCLSPLMREVIPLLAVGAKKLLSGLGEKRS